jgi:hypothetical protein
MAVIRLTTIILSIRITEHLRLQLPVPSAILLIRAGHRRHIPSMIRNSSRSIAEGIRVSGIHVSIAIQILQTIRSLIVSAAIRMRIAGRITQMHNATNVIPQGMQIETFLINGL